MELLALITAVGFIAGFLAGFAVRNYISLRRRRQRVERRDNPLLTGSKLTPPAERDLPKNVRSMPPPSSQRRKP
jgi:hypothetical protein